MSTLCGKPDCGEPAVFMVAQVSPHDEERGKPVVVCEAHLEGHGLRCPSSLLQLPKDEFWRVARLDGWKNYGLSADGACWLAETGAEDSAVDATALGAIRALDGAPPLRGEPSRDPEPTVVSVSTGRVRELLAEVIASRNGCVGDEAMLSSLAEDEGILRMALDSDRLRSALFNLVQAANRVSLDTKRSGREVLAEFESHMSGAEAVLRANAEVEA